MSANPPSHKPNPIKVGLRIAHHGAVILYISRALSYGAEVGYQFSCLLLAEACRLTSIDALTPRQSQVLALVAAGHSNCEIGARLRISENTVEAHLRSIYQRLAVHSRVEATRVYLGRRAPPVNGNPG